MNFKSILRLAAVVSVTLAGAGTAAAAPASNPSGLWADVAARAIPLVGERQTTPLKARTVTVDALALQAQLAQAQGAAKGSALPLLRLPLPLGGELAFAIRETQVMSPKLAAKFPQIRTYQGSVVGQPGISGRFQMDPRGFRAMVFTPQGTYYIDPYSRGDTRNYQVYYASDLPQKARPGDEVRPRLAPLAAKKSSLTNGLSGTANKGVSISGELRTYRLALAANFEYSSYHDPIVPPDNLLPRIPVVLAELVNVTNRVSGVYERELGIRLQLVDNNDQIIFNTPASPYVDADGTNMLVTNIAVLNAVIGEANYDIGHVTSTGGGGVAFLGVVCGLQKAGGVTGLPTPIGDDYYIDFVAHEMGHQFGGNHTFNGTTGSCSGNGGSDVAFEPGSGVTIMAYAGICGAQNIAPHSIDTFHAASFDEIIAFSRDTAEGASCGAASTSANRAPVVSTPAGGFSIPKGTPFELTGSATDPDGDSLRYQWEQFDLGAAGAPNAAATVTTSTPPLFRNFLPTVSPTRVFPKIDDIVSNQQIIGEILPQVPRVMKFRLTARDNYRVPSEGSPDTTDSFEQGGVASEDLTFNIANAGPFLVSFPNAAGLSFNGRSTQTVTWDVAGTTAAPVSCANVDLFLSTDGGFTYPITVMSGAANDGSQEVTMPNVGTTTARMKVKCANNIFFDISNSNFTIVEIVNNAPSATLNATPVRGTAPLTVSFDSTGSSDPDEGDAVISYNFGYGEGAASDFQTGSSATHTYNTPGTYTATLAVRDSFGLASTRAATKVIEVLAPAAVSPQAFTFVRRSDVPLNTFITSEAVTLSGFTGSLPVSVSSGTQYSINRGANTSAAGSVLAGDTLALRHTSAATGATETASSVTVGSYSTPFVSVTTTEDRVPDAFGFGTKTEVAPSTVITSDEFTLSGYNAAAAIVAGPGLEYSLDGAAFTRVNGSLPLGGKLRVRHTSSGSSLGYAKTTLKVGGVSGTFTTRTRK